MRFENYKYFLNNQPTGISEKFGVRNLPGGLTQTICERNTSIHGTMIYADAKRRGELFEKFEIRITNEKNPETADVRAVYRFSGNNLHFTRERNDETVDDEIIALPENCLVFPLMRCFQGRTILQVAEKRTAVSVLVPDIQNPNDAGNLLRPIFDMRSAEFLGREQIGFWKKDSGDEDTIVAREANLYRYISKHYDDNSRFWINDEGLLIAYRFQPAKEQIWDVYLESAFSLPHANI